MEIINNIRIKEVTKCEILDISDEEYFSKEYTEYISNSKLSLINPAEGGTPQMFKEGLAAHREYSEAMEFGDALHKRFLQPDDYHVVNDIDKPSGKPVLIANWLLKNNFEFTDENLVKGANVIDYYRNKFDEDKLEGLKEKIKDYYIYMKDREVLDSEIFLSSYNRWRHQQCLDSLNSNGDVKALFHPDLVVMNEQTIITHLNVEVPFENDVKLITLKFKGKLDNVCIDEMLKTLTLNDLKTTGHEISRFQESIAKFHYQRQLGLYVWFLKHFYKDITTINTNIIAVETIKPFNSKIIPISLEEIKLGLKEASGLIKRVAFHEVYGYDTNMEDYEYV